MATKDGNRYSKLIEYIFLENYGKEAQEVNFLREDLVSAAKELGIELPKNLGDVIYSFRYRTALPESIRELAPDGLEWVIRSVGQAKYKFSLTAMPHIVPNSLLAEIKIPDATPGIIARYALNDEQALLAKLRYDLARYRQETVETISRKRLHAIEGIGEDQEVSGEEHDKYL